MQSFNESGWGWPLTDALQTRDGPTNALASLATFNKPNQMMGGIGSLAPSLPNRRPNYLEAWAAANVGNELQKPFWTHDELVAILLGLDPFFARFEDFGPNMYKDNIATEGIRLHEIVQRAHQVGELSIEPSPQEALDWALQRHIQVPRELLTIAAQRNIALLNSPTQLETIVSESAARIAKLNTEIEHWKGMAESNTAAVEDACTKLRDRDTEIIELTRQLSEAVCQTEQLQSAASTAGEKNKSPSAATREYRTSVKLLCGVVSKNYGYSPTSANWQKKKLEADLAECGTPVNDETLMKHLRAGSEEASR